MTTIVQAYQPGGGVNTGTTQTFSPAATAGNSLIMWLHQTASGNNTVNGVNDTNANAFIQDYTAIDSVATEGIRVYRRTNIANTPNTLSVTASGAATGVYYGMLEVAGMDNVSPWVNTTYIAEASTTNHSITFTTTTPNAIVMIGIRNATDFGTLGTLPAGWFSAGLVRNAADMIYTADAGAPGSKTIAFSSSLSGGGAHYYVTEYKAAVTDPTVTTVTGSTVNEGTANRFTGVLSGPTNRTTDYAVNFGGTAVNGTDYNNDLSAATFSTGASYVPGVGIRLLTGYSGFTVDVPTIDNAINQDTRTLTMTVGLVASTGGNITDNDPAPSIGVSDATESFGVLTFNVNMSAASGKVVTVDCGTADGTKAAGTDYQAKSVTVGFNPGDLLTKQVSVPTGPAPAAQVLRYASPYNNVTEANSVAAETTYLSVRARIPFIVGSGDFSELVLALGAWNLFGGTINFLGNAYTLDSCAFEKNGAAASVPVNFSGGRSRVVADGTAESLSDSFYASLMALANIPRGTKIWMRFQYSVASAGLKLPRGKLSISQWGIGASAYLLTAVNDCSPVDGVGAMTASTGATNFTNPYVPIVLGKFVSGDPKTFLGFGDSILGGYLDDAVTYPQKGSFSKALTDADFLSNPIAGANFGYTGSSTALWWSTNSNMLTPYIKYAKYAVDECDKIAANNGNLAATKTDIQALWALMVANGIKTILRVKLNPRSTNSDGTLPHGTAWSVAGGDAAAFNSWLDTPGIGPSNAVLSVLTMVAIRASIDQTTDNFLRWAGATSGNLGPYTSDGTHPNAAGHVLQAANYRAAFGVLT